MNKYTKQGRLSDVIALISLLSVDEHTFRTIENLNDALRGKPQSAEKWENIAAMHPEFFRFNGNRTSIALLIRSYFTQGEDKKRAPLSVSETQKQIDTAIALSDKEIQLKQRHSHLFSIFVALIAVGGVIFNTVYSNRSNNKVSEEIHSLNTKMKHIEDKIMNLN